MRPVAFSLLAAALAAVAVAQAPQGRPLAHPDTVYAVAFSPDGKTVATGCFDKAARIFDVATGKELRTIAGKAGHQNLVVSVAYSTDGSQLVTTSTDNFAKVWDIPTGKPASQFAHATGVTKIAVSADGKLIAAGATDGSIRLWTAADGKQTFELKGHAGPVVGLGFAANAATLYSFGADHTLRYWTPADGKAVGVVGVGGGEPTGFAMNLGTGQPMTVTADGQVKVWPAALPAAPKPLTAPTGVPVASFLSTDGAQLLAATDDKKLKAWATATGVPVALLETLPAVPVAVAANANNSTYAVATADGRVHLVGADAKPRGTVLAHTAGVLALAFHPSQPQLLTLGKDGLAKTWTVPAAAPVAGKPTAHPDAVTAMTFSADGKKVFTGSADKVVRLWSAGTVERPYHGHTAAVTAVTVAGDAVVSGDASGEVIVFNAADAKVLAKLPSIKKPVRLIATTAAKAVAVVAADREVSFFPTLPVMPKEKEKEKEKDKEPKKFAHPKPVVAAFFSADGKKLTTICEDGKVRLWNVDSGKDEGTFALTTTPTAVALSADKTKVLEVGLVGNARQVVLRPLAADGKPQFAVPLADEAEAVALSPDGTRFAVATKAGNTRAVKLFDAATGVELQTVEEPKAAVRGLLFAADGKSLLFAGDDKQVSTADWSVISARPTGANPVLGAVLPQAGWVVSAAADKSVSIWEATAGGAAKEVKKLGVLPDAAKVLFASRDGAVVVAASGKVVKIWQTADGKELPFPALPADATHLALSADRARLAVGFADNSAVVYAVATGLPEQVVRHAGPITGLAFHPAQPLLFSANADKTFAVTPLVLVRQVADPVRFGGLFTLFPNGASTVSTGTGEGVVRANAGNGTTEATLGKSKSVTAVAVNKANTLLGVAEADGTVTVFNLNNAAESAPLKAPAKVTELAFHPTLPLLAGVLADNRAMSWAVAFDPADTKPEDKQFGKVVQDFPHPAGVKGTAFSADGATLFTGCEDKNLRVWKTVSDAARFSLQHPNMVNAAAFNKEGTLLATAGQDGILRVYDLTKPAGTAPKAINAHVPMAPATPQPVYAVLFTPDGKQVISCSFDKSIKIHDATAGTLVKEIKPAADKVPGHSDAVYALALSPDGKALASGSADRTVKLWNPATGELIREFKNTVDPKLKDMAHPGYVQGLKFTPDGTKLVTVGTAPRNKGYLAVWNVADGKQLSGQELDLGPLHAVDVRADGLLVLGCASKVRSQSAADAVLLPMPK